jgi:hypothetical protein
MRCFLNDLLQRRQPELVQMTSHSGPYRPVRLRRSRGPPPAADGAAPAA